MEGPLMADWHLRLDDDVATRIDEAARQLGLTRAQIIGRCLDICDPIALYPEIPEPFRLLAHIKACADRLDALLREGARASITV